MTNFYHLSSSMSDRMNYDSMAEQCGYEAAQSIGDVDFLMKADPKELAREAWDGAICADQIGFAQTHEEAENFPVAVDDIEEAEARWMSAWATGFEKGKGKSSN